MSASRVDVQGGQASCSTPPVGREQPDQEQELMHLIMKDYTYSKRDHLGFYMF